MDLGLQTRTIQYYGQKLQAIGFSVLVVISVLGIATALVLAFGAVGGAAAQTNTCEATVTDGNTIQDAIDAAQPGDTICVETGTYNERVTIGENSAGEDLDGLSLVAADGHSPTIEQTGSSAVVSIDADDVTVEGFEIVAANRGIDIGDTNPGSTDGSGAVIHDNDVTVTSASGFFGIRIAGPDAVLTDNVVDAPKDVELRVTHYQGPFGGPSVRNAQNATLTDNDLSNGLAFDTFTNTGERPPGMFAHTVTGNTVGGESLVYLSGASDETITDAGQVIVFDSTNVTVDGLAFDQKTLRNIFVVHSTDVVVTDAVLTDSSNINVLESPGTTIDSSEFTRSGGVTIRWSPNTVVQNSVFTDNTESIRVVFSAGTTVENNTVTGTTHGGSSGAAFAAVNIGTSENVALESNTITDNQANGIGTVSGGGGNSHGAFMANNTVADNGRLGIYWVFNERATFVNNTVTGNDREGIDSRFEATVRQNTVEGNGNTGIRVSDDSLVENNLVRTNSGNGITVSGSDTTIRDNEVHNNEGNGVTLGPVGTFVDDGSHLVVNNTISSHEASLVISAVQDITVQGNTFDRGVLLSPSSTAPEATLTTHEFVDNTVGGKPLYYANDEETLTMPADPGQVIVVNSPGVTVSDRTFDDVIAGVQIAFSDEVTVSEVTITNSTRENNDQGTLRVWNSANAEITDNTFVDNDGNGIDVYNSENVALSENVMTNTERRGVMLTTSPDAVIENSTFTDTRYASVEVDQSPRTQVTNITVEGGAISDSFLTRNGIRIDRSHNATVAHSTVTGSDGNGIGFDRSPDIVITDNVITASERSGIADIDGSYSLDIDASITNNTVESNEIGIKTFGRAVEITGNEVASNSIGIEVGQNTTVAENTVTDNIDVGIHADWNPDGVAINFNDIENNGIGVEYDRGTQSGYEPLNATHNWWGAANGPSGGETDPVTGAVADGDGDAVDFNVQFDPWIGASIDVTDASVDKTDVGVGEDVLVSGTLENTGSFDGTATLSLEIDAVEVDSQTVSVAAGETESFEFTYSFGQAGTYNVSVNGVEAGTVTVTQDAAELEYSNLTVSTNQLYTGSTVVVSATVENTGGDTGNYEAPLIVDSQVVETRSGTLEAGESHTVRFFRQLKASGEFDVTIDDLPAETVSVTGAWAQFGFGDNNVGTGPDLTGPVLSAEEQWSYTVGSQFFDRVRSSPAVADGIVYVGAGGGQIHAVDRDTGEAEWTFDVDGSLTNGHAATVNDGVVYAATGATDTGTVYAIDADTGTEEWSVAIGEPLTSTVVVDGVVYVGSEDGTLYAFDASDGSEVWTFETARQIRATPAVSDGFVYVATMPPQSNPVNEKIHAVDATTGEEVWNADEWALGDAALAVSDGVLYAGDFAGNVYAFDTADGTQLWETSLGGQIQGAPSVADDIVYVGSSDNHVYALNATSGAEIWSFETGSNVRSAPAIANGVVYVGSYDTNVYALNALTGDELWQFETDGLIWSSPAVLDGTVYIGSDDRHLYAIGEAGPEPNFRFGASLSAETIEVGETVDIVVNTTNSGGDGEFTAELELDGDGIATQTETIPSGETRELTFTRQFDDPGTFQLSVNGLDLPLLEVTEPDAAATGQLNVSTTSLTFGSIVVGETGTATLTLTNTGDSDLTVGPLSIAGSDANAFTVSPPEGTTLAQAESKELTVSFTPETTGSKTATLEIPSADPETPIVSVSLSGTGETAPSSPGTGGTAPGGDDEPAAEPDDPDEATATPVVDEESGTSTVTFSEGSAVESITFNSPDVTEPVTVRRLGTETELATPSPGVSMQNIQILVPDNAANVSATIQLQVSNERISALQVEPEDLRVSHHNATTGAWRALETQQIGETETHVRLEAVTPGFSIFSVSAVSTPEAVIDAPAAAKVGEEITLDGANSTDRYGEIVAYEWVVGGETLDGPTVTTAIDESGDVTVELTVENDAGETNSTTAMVTITDSEDPDSEETDDGSTTDDTEPEPDDDSQPGFGVGPAVFALLVGAMLLVRHRYVTD